MKSLCPCSGKKSGTRADVPKEAWSRVIPGAGERLNVCRAKNGKSLVPKAWTPNRDNLNDVLKIEYGAGLKTFNFFRIFNRFGKIVFQTNRLTDSWDGKFNGIDQEMDAYTYLIDYVTYKDEHITKTGSFILLR
jgi:gliding motility-associated-like protein